MARVQEQGSQGGPGDRQALHAPTGWRALGHFSSDPVWHAITLYAVADALLVHRGRTGVIAELRKEAGGEVVVHDRGFAVQMTLGDARGHAGEVLLPPRTSAVPVLRRLGWVRGVPASTGSFRCRARRTPDGRMARAYLDVSEDEVCVQVKNDVPIVVRRADGGEIDGEQTLTRTHLTIGDHARTRAWVTLGRRDPALRVLRQHGWITRTRG